MGLGQLSALTGGRQYRPNYISQINAQVPYLPALYSQKKDEEWQNKNYDLDKQRFEQEKTFGLAELGLARDAAKQAKKQANLAEKLGYANLGLNATLGGADLAGSLLDRFGGTGKVVDTGIGTGVGNSFEESILSPSTYTGDVVKSPDTNWLSGGVNDFLSPFKKIGGDLWDTATGLYDSVVGSLFSSGSDAADSLSPWEWF